MFLIRCLGCLVILAASSAGSQAGDDRLHIWVRAFIPKQLDGNPTYLKPVPGRVNQFMISSPSLFKTDTFFATDHRTFSPAPDVSSRLTTEFVLVIDTSSVKVERAGNRPFHRASSTERLTVEGQQVKSEKKAAVLRVDALGQPEMASGMVQIAGQAAASNPFLPSPWVDYSFDFIYKPASKTLQVKATIGAFPAFEGYASLNGGAPVTLFQGATTVDHAAGLFDLGTGLNSRRIDEKVKF